MIITEDDGHEDRGTKKIGSKNNVAEGAPQIVLYKSADTYTQAAKLRTGLNSMEDTTLHLRLQKQMVSDIWAIVGRMSSG